MKEDLTKEEVKNLARLTIERIAPSNDGIRAVNSGTFSAIKAIEEIFELNDL